MFWGLIRTPPEKRDHDAIDASRDKTTAAMKILDAQLAKTAFIAGNSFSMGDIPVALMAYRFRRLVPERSGLDNLERWFSGIEQRPAFKEHVLAIPFV
jgi:glutathione S-transferase